MRIGVTISADLHAAALAWGLMSFSAKPFEAAPMESMPVDLITASEFSQIMAGPRSATEGRDAEAAGGKGGRAEAGEGADAQGRREEARNRSVRRTATARARAREEGRHQAGQGEARAQGRRDRRGAGRRTRQRSRRRPRQRCRRRPKKPAPQAPKFDAERITALLDKRNPQRVAAAGEVVNTTPALGASTGSAPTLSASEIDLFRARLRECWDVPAALRDTDKISNADHDPVQDRRHPRLAT